MDPSVHSCPTDAMGRAGMPNGFTVGDCPADDCGKIRAIFGWPALALGWSVCHGGNLLLHSSTSSAWSGQPKSQARAALRRGRPLTLTPTIAGASSLRGGIFPASDAAAFILAMLLRADSVAPRSAVRATGSCQSETATTDTPPLCTCEPRPMTRRSNRDTWHESPASATSPGGPSRAARLGSSLVDHGQSANRQHQSAHIRPDGLVRPRQATSCSPDGRRRLREAVPVRGGLQC